MSPGLIDQPGAVRDGEELDDRALAAYLRDRSEIEGDLEVLQFPAGWSNLTYLIRAGGRELVLRRPPHGARAEAGHDMAREYRILSALDGHWGRVPSPVLYCGDDAVIGTPFYLMERVKGVILRGRPTPDRAPPPETMTALAGSLVDLLVELHALDHRALGLDDLGRPQGYVRRQVDGWTRRYQAARTDDLPELDRVARWLDEHRPPESGAALIHNDLKYDNVVLDPADPSRIRAVLDWEMATIGDPLMDLGTTLAYWVEPTDPEFMKALGLGPTTLPGNPGRAALVELYEAGTGHRVDEVVFYYAYGLFKLAVIIQQIYWRYRQGHTSDPRFEGLGEGVRVCTAVAARAVDRGRIDRLFD